MSRGILDRQLLLTVALLGVGGATACGSSRIEPSPGGRPRADSILDGPTGQVIVNGLIPDVYHENKTALSARMTQLLVDPGGTNTLHSQFDAILTKPDGDELVGYAVDCAISGTVTRPPAVFNGSAVLTSAGAWPAKALDSQGRDDVHACILTRLNPTAANVSIWVRGPNVANRNHDTCEYRLDEALWAVDGNLRVHVWPSQHVLDHCPSDKGVDPVAKRVCGTSPATCNLEQRKDRSTACTFSPTAGWSCDVSSPTGPKTPVIESIIRCDNWSAFYPDCKLPAICAEAPACPPAPSP